MAAKRAGVGLKPDPEEPPPAPLIPPPPITAELQPAPPAEAARRYRRGIGADCYGVSNGGSVCDDLKSVGNYCCDHPVAKAADLAALSFLVL